MSTQSGMLNTVRLYATRHWTYHYHKVGEQRRKEFFEYCAKRFFFDGVNCSEAWEIWTTEGSSRIHNWSREERAFLGSSFPLIDILISPVLLACRFGWLEILDHYETYQSSHGFSASATEMMNVAIRYGSASVVRWLLDRKVCLRSGQLELAFDLRQLEILQIFLDEDGDEFMRPVLKSYEPGTACLLLRYGTRTACLLSRWGTDSMIGVSEHAQLIGILDSVAMIPTLQSDSSVSVTTRSGKQARGPDDLLQQLSQTLLSLAAICRHEKAFRVLLGWGTNPTYQTIRDSQKRASTVTHTGHSMSGQQTEGQKRRRNSTSGRQTEGHKHRRNANKEINELRLGPLAWAAYTGNLSLVQSTLDQDMDPNIQNRRGQAPLYFAAQKVEDKYSRIDLEADKEAIVRLLLRKGALVTSADAYGGATVLAHAFLARYSGMAHILVGGGALVPKGAIGGPMKQLLVTFDRGREEIRKALHERIRAAEVNSLDLQPPISSGDRVGIAAQLMLGGTMRVLGNAILAACGDISDATRTGFLF